MKDVSARTVRPSRHARRPKQRILVNFPPELANRLRDLAERERRPLSTQIDILVERALDNSAEAEADDR